MPAAAKSFWPAFAAFMAVAGTYTTTVARGEGKAMDSASTRYEKSRSAYLRGVTGGADLEPQKQAS
ncbi:uncharacterized protein BDZ99DRAFT_458528 [Mytilinidion resinicola]|uniref:Secreted protein n=1 Tax=Mytilinidion resinicola TaxID=574789 RepID=A0A6A6Z8S2_9PEZI|nr:uncharacterized protein BDZ99DRAFT_458528 [Mytilinidion resinicola]KAF2816685.1 hypothetical protein BDZ99DRAFT_458528 [Mytilinidion resinicola]